MKATIALLVVGMCSLFTARLSERLAAADMGLAVFYYLVGSEEEDCTRQGGRCGPGGDRERATAHAPSDYYTEDGTYAGTDNPGGHDARRVEMENQSSGYWSQAWSAAAAGVAGEGAGVFANWSTQQLAQTVLARATSTSAMHWGTVIARSGPYVGFAVAGFVAFS